MTISESNNTIRRNEAFISKPQLLQLNVVNKVTIPINIKCAVLQFLRTLTIRWEKVRLYTNQKDLIELNVRNRDDKPKLVNQYGKCCFILQSNKTVNFEFNFP